MGRRKKNLSWKKWTKEFRKRKGQKVCYCYLILHDKDKYKIRGWGASSGGRCLVGCRAESDPQNPHTKQSGTCKSSSRELEQVYSHDWLASQPSLGGEDQDNERLSQTTVSMPEEGYPGLPFALYVDMYSCICTCMRVWNIHTDRHIHT